MTESTSSEFVCDGQPVVTLTPAKADPVHQDPAGAPIGTNGHPQPQENGPSEKFELLQQWHSQPRKLRVIHVGAGATGLCAAFKMERQLTEYELVCYDENDDVGGTWLKSRYPGCACDVPAHIYTYTFEPNPHWSSYYASGPEIHKYFVGFCDKYGLGKYVKLRHRVLGATWHEDKAQWEVAVEHDGQTFTDWCHILVNGSGLLNKYRWPEIEGLHSFKGALMHSANWDDSVDYSGKRVAVLGNGSSAIQIIPQVQKVASQVKCFMRGSTWISAPMSRIPVEISNGGDEVVEDKNAMFPNEGQYFYTEREKNHLANNPEYLLEYRKRIETDISLGFAIFYKDSEASRMAEQYMKTEMKRRLKDHPILTQKLIPGWPVGCRRLTPGDGYLEALLQPNVTTTFSEISTISETGLFTSDGVYHEVDVIICATGYDIAWTPHFGLVGRRGRDIKEAWSPTPKCYLGMAAPGFPNYFVMNGPRGNLANGTVLPCFETELDYVIQAAKKMQADRIKILDVREEVVDHLNEYIDAWQETSVFSGHCRSWYKDNTVDGKVLVWGGSNIHFLKTLKTPRWEHYNMEYLDANPWAFLGNGRIKAEAEHNREALAPYLRHSDTPWTIE
ncbi:4-hydroxyacetophenone monooxygenase [Colletotrichum karsti]|uniref:4-hydroxyacetophenone monooxygenase n=1 Tax=Colletotrichum karsti TaxID=1095194 RepID=A0A9P6I060_9PEZI|nr:4-hydroxyacetophenone monooxygenase [Colletotrichum karsti]KAF9872441.1 4-hydroxyacetophenone monooxygenase [Colletotrichum karsti]